MAVRTPQGLFDPQHERDACGFGMVAQLDDQPSRLLVDTAINEFLGNGFDRYELMAGQAEYKRSLAMAEGSMAWLSIDRVGWRARIVDLYRRRRGQDALP